MYRFLRELTWLMFIWVLPVVRSAEADRPHIIVIQADDLGWNDVGYHGMTAIPTPNIDALAADGVTLHNYYGAPMCTPSRAALHTGRYPSRLGLQHFLIPDAGPWGLPLEVPTLADKLAPLGYVSRLVGKWHLGFYRNEYLPTNRGFDSHYGFWTGALDFFSHRSESEAPRLEFINVPDNVTDENIAMYGQNLRDDLIPRDDQSGEYLTDLLTSRAVDIISKHNASQPLFMLLAHHAPHRGFPLKPTRAPDRYTAAFAHISNDTRRNFAGALTALDESVGIVMSELSRRKMLTNSLVIFVSDNGADIVSFSANGGSNWPLRGQKMTAWEGGVRLPAIIWSPLLKNPGRLWKGLSHVTDWLPTLYAVAGGQGGDLSDLDGLNLWEAISNNLSSPRIEALLMSDPVWDAEALRSGDFKIVKGKIPNRATDGWLSDSGRDSAVHFLETRKCLTDSVLADFRGLSFASGPARVDELVCGGEKPSAGQLDQEEEILLFDLSQDPCEYRNIAAHHPQLVQKLLERLKVHREMAAPPLNTKRDYLANPLLHDDKWVPWRSL